MYTISKNNEYVVCGTLIDILYIRWVSIGKNHRRVLAYYKFRILIVCELTMIVWLLSYCTIILNLKLESLIKDPYFELTIPGDGLFKSKSVVYTKHIITQAKYFFIFFLSYINLSAKESTLWNSLCWSRLLLFNYQL